MHLLAQGSEEALNGCLDVWRGRSIDAELLGLIFCLSMQEMLSPRCNDLICMTERELWFVMVQENNNCYAKNLMA